MRVRTECGGNTRSKQAPAGVLLLWDVEVNSAQRTYEADLSCTQIARITSHLFIARASLCNVSICKFNCNANVKNNAIQKTTNRINTFYWVYNFMQQQKTQVLV